MELEISRDFVAAISRKRPQVRIACPFLPLRVRPRSLVDPLPLPTDFEIHLAIELPIRLFELFDAEFLTCDMRLPIFGSHRCQHLQIRRGKRFHDYLSLVTRHLSLQSVRAAKPASRFPTGRERSLGGCGSRADVAWAGRGRTFSHRCVFLRPRFLALLELRD